MFKTGFYDALIQNPAVFAVGTDYRIMILTPCPALVSLQIGEKTYMDHSNGILRSESKIHSIQVPMEDLDKAGEYTVCCRKVTRRKVEFPGVQEEVRRTFSFKPVKPGAPVHICHISDSHGAYQKALQAGSYWGKKLDLLVLNGDISNHCSSRKDLQMMVQLAGEITKGSCPCVYARGNHELRGKYAEQLERYTPTSFGKSYYTFRLGPIWGLILDCGEDKMDDHPEYGHTAAFHEFRQEETRWLEEISESREFLTDDIQYRLAICHVPFTHREEPPFNIEEDIYSHWAQLLRDQIHPDLMLCGHVHRCELWPVGEKEDHLGQPCPVLIGGKPVKKHHRIADVQGAAVLLEEQKAEISFMDSRRRILGQSSLPLPHSGNQK